MVGKVKREDGFAHVYQGSIIGSIESDQNLRLIFK